MKAIFRNFLVTLRRFRLASALNILGLSVAFAAFIVIMIQVRHEQTFDTCYKKSGRIYRVDVDSYRIKSLFKGNIYRLLCTSSYRNVTTLRSTG